jgi:hypothetical protein
VFHQKLQQSYAIRQNTFSDRDILPFVGYQQSNASPGGIISDEKVEVSTSSSSSSSSSSSTAANVDLKNQPEEAKRPWSCLAINTEEANSATYQSSQ